MRDEENARNESVKFEVNIPEITVNVYSDRLSREDQALLDDLLRASARIVRKLERLDRQTPDTQPKPKEQP